LEPSAERVLEYSVSNLALVGLRILKTRLPLVG